MRGSRGLWLTFALAIAGALVVVPIGVSRSRASAASASSSTPSVVAVPAGWATYSPDDGSFQVTGPADVHSSAMTTGIGPARRAEFGDGTLSVTWLGAPVAGTDAQALAAGEESLLRPLVGRTADEEVDLLDAGHPGFGLLITIEGTTYDVRLFASNGRLYQVVGQAPAGSPQVDDAIRFVDSFELG